MTAIQTDSRELMARAKAGDVDAFAQLYTRYRPYIRQVICRRASSLDNGNVEDLIQETMLRAWRGLGGYQPTGADARAWLAVIARRLVVDYYRALGYRCDERPAGMSVDPVDEPEAGNDPARTVEDRAQVVAMLSKLSPAHRQVLALHYLADLPLAQIASRVGLSDATVKTRIFYARRAARELAVADA